MKFFTWDISTAKTVRRLWGLWPNWSFEFIILAKLGGEGAVRSRLQAACPGIMFFSLKLFIFLMYVSVLVDCLSVHNMYAWCLRRLEGGITSPELVLMNCCEPLCGCQESSSGPLKGNKFPYLPVGIIPYTSLYCISLPRSWCEPCPQHWLTSLTWSPVSLPGCSFRYFLMIWKLLWHSPVNPACGRVLLSSVALHTIALSA